MKSIITGRQGRQVQKCREGVAADQIPYQGWPKGSEWLQKHCMEPKGYHW